MCTEAEQLHNRITTGWFPLSFLSAPPTTADWRLCRCYTWTLHARLHFTLVCLFLNDSTKYLKISEMKSCELIAITWSCGEFSKIPSLWILLSVFNDFHWWINFFTVEWWTSNCLEMYILSLQIMAATVASQRSLQMFFLIVKATDQQTYNKLTLAKDKLNKGIWLAVPDCFFTQKWKYCYQLLALMLFQSLETFFHLWNTNLDNLNETWELPHPPMTATILKCLM